MGSLFFGSQKVVPVFSASVDQPIGTTLMCPDYSSYTTLLKGRVHKIYEAGWIMSPEDSTLRYGSSTGAVLSELGLRSFVPFSGSSYVFLSNSGSNARLYSPSNTVAYAPDLTSVLLQMSAGNSYTLSADCWVRIEGSLRLNDSSGELLKSGGTRCWMPFEAGTTVYIDDAGATAYAMSQTVITTPNFNQYSTLASGRVHSIPEDCYIFSPGTVRLNAYNGVILLNTGRAMLPIEKDTIVWVAGTDATLYKCAEEA